MKSNKMKSINLRLMLCLIIAWLIHNNTFAQIAINTDGSNPNTSAMLDVQSTDKGMLIPRMDSTARNTILNPATGLLVYDTSTISFWYYDNNQWNEIRNSNAKLTPNDLLDTLPEPDLACLKVKGTLGIGSFPNDVVVSDNYAYVVDLGSKDLKVIDISNPAIPNEVGAIGIEELSYAVAVSGNYAYIIDGNKDSIKIIDVSNPTTPSWSGSLKIGGDPFAIAVSGDYAYVTSFSSNDLKVINVSVPVAPSLTSSLSLGGTPQDIVVSGNYAYVTSSGSNDIKVIDISNPAAPNQVGVLGIGDAPLAVAVSGNYAYVVDDNDEDIKIIDISNPTAPNQVGNLTLGVSPWSIAISNNYAYVTDIGNNDLKVINVSDPTAPALEGSLEIGTDPVSIAVAGNYAYVIDENNDDLKAIQIFCDNLISYNPVDGQFETIINVDNQVVDKFNLSSTTLQLSLEDDGESDYTVDLSSFLDNTDNQTIDKLNLNSTTLELSLQNDGEADQTVDLSSINTDNQTIDKLELDGTTLEVSLSNDGQADETVDLASLNTDEQTLSLNGATLSISNGNSVDLSSLAPIGTIQMWPTSTPPSGWIICDGSVLGSNEYTALQAVLGTDTIPDFRGRFPLGVGNSGENGSASHYLGQKDGEETHTLTIDEMPAHSHGLSFLKRNKSGNGTDVSDLTGSGSSASTDSVGGSQAHNNMPPYYTINFIIKAEF